MSAGNWKEARDELLCPLVREEQNVRGAERLEQLDAGEAPDGVDEQDVVPARLLREAEQAEEHDRADDRAPARKLAAQHDVAIHVPQHSRDLDDAVEARVRVRPRDPRVHLAHAHVQIERPGRERNGEADVSRGEAHEPEVARERHAIALQQELLHLRPPAREVPKRES